MAKLLAGLVALGTAAFGLIGATTGDLALLLRNHTWLTGIALGCGVVLIIVTALVAMRPKSSWQWVFFAVCLALVVGGLGCLFAAKVLIQADRVSPTVTAEWEMIGSSAVVKITAEADDVAEAHVLWVGVASGDDTLYTGATGPDVDGKTKQTAKVVVPTAVKEPVTIAAAVVTKTDSPVDAKENMTCFGIETAIPPASSPTPSVSPTQGPQAACIALTEVPAPVPTPTAS